MKSTRISLIIASVMVLLIVVYTTNHKSLKLLQQFITGFNLTVPLEEIHAERNNDTMYISAKKNDLYNRSGNSTELRKAQRKPINTVGGTGSHKHNQTQRLILGRPMEEPVHVSFTDNIYFTIKTTERNYKSRLSVLMMTWLQLVKHKVCDDCTIDGGFTMIRFRTCISLAK